jgi:hypothetical protein
MTKHREGADFGLVASSRSIAPCVPTGGTACTNRSWKWCRIGNCACGHQQRTGISRRRFESIHQPYVGRGRTNGTGTLASSVFSANKLSLKGYFVLCRNPNGQRFVRATRSPGTARKYLFRQTATKCFRDADLREAALISTFSLLIFRLS